MRGNSGIIGQSVETSSTTATGIFDTYDQYQKRTDDQWPQFQVESISNSNGTSVNEGTVNTFTISTSGIPNSTTLYYSLETLSGTTLTSADFTVGDVTGSFSITSNSGSFILTPTADGLSESNTFRINIRRGSTSGDIIKNSETFTIGDAAVPSGNPEFTWKYHAYGTNCNTTRVYWVTSGGTANLLRTITGQQQASSSAAWTSYSENLSAYSGQTGRIYIAYEQGTSFRQDVAFDDMLLVDTTAGDIIHDPGNTTGRTRWSRRSNGSTTSLTIPSSDTFVSVPISTAASNHWCFDIGGTPSGSTGPDRDAAGVTNAYYLYFEGSSPNYGSSGVYFWLRMSSDYTLL